MLLRRALSPVLVWSTLLLSCRPGAEPVVSPPVALPDAGARCADLHLDQQSTSKAADATPRPSHPDMLQVQPEDIPPPPAGASSIQKNSEEARRDNAADARRLSRALRSLGLPAGITKSLLRIDNKHEPDCAYRHDPSKSTAYVFSFLYPRGRGKKSYAVVEQVDALPVHSIAMATPDFGAFMKHLFRSGFKPVRGSGYHPRDVAVYQKQRVRVFHHRFWPMVDDVVSNLSRCTGQDRLSIQREQSIIVISLLPGGSPR